jgi:hypothetical protein
MVPQDRTAANGEKVLIQPNGSNVESELHRFSLNLPSPLHGTLSLFDPVFAFHGSSFAACRERSQSGSQLRTAQRSELRGANGIAVTTVLPLLKR